MKNKSSVNILLVDDDAADRELFIDAVHDIDVMCNIHEAGNGKELIDILQAGHHVPDAIFLDLNMPVMDGMQALRYLKKSRKYKVIPVFVMSTSCSTQDVFDSYDAGANLFLVKPASYGSLVLTLKNLLGLFLGSLAIAETAHDSFSYKDGRSPGQFQHDLPDVHS